MQLSNQILPKCMENYISVQIVCLRYLDSYRFLPNSLDKLVQSRNEFHIMDSLNLTDELVKLKIAHPYESFNSQNMHEPLNLTKNFRSKQTQSFASDKDIERSNELINKFGIQTGQQLTML